MGDHPKDNRYDRYANQNIDQKFYFWRHGNDILVCNEGYNQRVRIKIEGLKCWCVIGLYPVERLKKQPVIVDLEYEYEPAIHFENEESSEIVDYHEISKKIYEIVKNSRCLLIETLAQVLLDYLFSNQKISYAKVILKKPRALRPALVSVMTEKSR